MDFKLRRQNLCSNRLESLGTYFSNRTANHFHFCSCGEESDAPYVYDDVMDLEWINLLLEVELVKFDKT